MRANPKAFCQDVLNPNYLSWEFERIMEHITAEGILRLERRVIWQQDVGRYAEEMLATRPMNVYDLVRLEGNRLKPRLIIRDPYMDHRRLDSIVKVAAGSLILEANEDESHITSLSIPLLCLYDHQTGYNLAAVPITGLAYAITGTYIELDFQFIQIQDRKAVNLNQAIAIQEN